jgi:hypothetical protein
VIARHEILDSRADRFHDARSLVAEHDRHRHSGPASVGRVQAAVADATGDHPHQDLPGPRPIEIDVFHPQGRLLLEQHGCAHASSDVQAALRWFARSRECSFRHPT